MEPIERAAEILGSQTALAELLGVSKGAVSQWKDAGRRVPAEYCPLIERATRDRGTPVTCEELRPDVDWGYLRHVTSEAERKPRAKHSARSSDKPKRSAGNEHAR